MRFAARPDDASEGPKSRTTEFTGTVAEICQRFQAGEKARGLAEPKKSPIEYLRLLDSNQLFADGMRFAAYALPSRGAIWWGSLCVWSIYRPTPPEKIAAALNAVTAWVQEPDEQSRRAAEQVINVAGLDTPAGGLAAAVFFTGENIAPPTQPEVKPMPYLWSKILAGALGRAATLGPPEKKKERERQFLSLAVDVAELRNHWDPRPSQGEVIVRARRR
jgi:hypothetical protein